MPTHKNEPTEEERARGCTLILSVQPDDSPPLWQFTREQTEACLWAPQWLFDFNLDRRPKPDFCGEILARLSAFHETQMNDHDSRRNPVGPSLTDTRTCR